VRRRAYFLRLFVRGLGLDLDLLCGLIVKACGDFSVLRRGNLLRRLVGLFWRRGHALRSLVVERGVVALFGRWGRWRWSRRWWWWHDCFRTHQFGLVRRTLVPRVRLFRIALVLFAARWAYEQESC